MAVQTSTKSFLNWMYSTSFEDIPSDVRKMTLLALYDGIGCNMARSMLPSAHRMVDFAKLVGGSPDCTGGATPDRYKVMCCRSNAWDHIGDWSKLKPKWNLHGQWD